MSAGNISEKPEKPEKRGESAARQWSTVTGLRRVLVIVPTLAYGKRLRDVVTLLESDFRIQVHFTAPPHPFGDGVRPFLRRLGGAVLPWKEAVRTRFDLALTTGPQGVAEIDAPVITLPHGANYLKRIVGAKGRQCPAVTGLRRSDLMPDGRTPPAAVVVPHRDDLRELAASCPEAIPRASVVGDPVHDRITASARLREDYRRALGLRDGERLVAVSSTWGPRSSFSRFETLLPRLLTELPAARHRVAILVHPNVWSRHGPWQVRSWLAPGARRGIGLLPPEEDWRPVLVAADHVIGDHGSITLYATLTSAPILLASAPRQEINPVSPTAALAATAPALSSSHPLVDQLEYATAEYRREEYLSIASRITSEPGRFNRNMRRLIYRTLGLGQPAHEPLTRPLPMPSPLDSWARG